MKSLVQSMSLKGKTLVLLAVLLPLLAAFIYVGLRSGPLAPVPVTVTRVQSKALTPAVFGIGTVEARYRHAVGPTHAGRLASLAVDVGDTVAVGQVLGEMDPVDLDDRILAQESAVERGRASVAEAQARLEFAQTQARRYERLFEVKSTSQEMHATKRQELRLAELGLNVVARELDRASADLDALRSQRRNLRLISPVDGRVVRRDVEPGTTVVAGQAVVEIIDPARLWVNTRFDQVSATGLAPGQSAQVQLRSRRYDTIAGEVTRLETLADAVTEEMLAKISFLEAPEPAPPIGELAEVTIELAGLPEMAVVPNAAIRRDAGQTIVWRVRGGSLERVPVKLGIGDLSGNVQVLEGLDEGDEVVVYSASDLNADTPFRLVTELVEAEK